jgi:hypothetical protein
MLLQAQGCMYKRFKAVYKIQQDDFTEKAW